MSWSGSTQEQNSTPAAAKNPAILTILRSSAEAMPDKEQPCEVTSSREEGSRISCFVLDGRPPFLARQADSLPIQDDLAPTLIPLFVKRRPSTETETRASPRAGFWPPAVVLGAVGVVCGRSVTRHKHRASLDLPTAHLYTPTSTLSSPAERRGVQYLSPPMTLETQKEA